MAAASTGRPRPRLEPWPRTSRGVARGGCRLHHRQDIALVARLVDVHGGQKRGRSGNGHLAGVDVHAAELGAAVQRGKYLARVEPMLGIEGAFQALLLGKVDLREHGAHEVALLHADAVLARQHAADLHAEPQDVGAQRLRPLRVAGDGGIVEDERVQVAVARVEHVGDAQAMLGGEFVHAGQHARQLGARDRPVHAEVVGADRADRREGVLAPLPELHCRSASLVDTLTVVAPCSRAMAETRSIRWSTSAAVPSSSTMTRAAASLG